MQQGRIKRILSYGAVGIGCFMIGTGLGAVCLKGSGASNKPTQEVSGKQNTTVLEQMLFEENVALTDYMELSEGTTQEMLSAEYWCQLTPDTLLYSAEEIAEFNENNPAFVSYTNKEGYSRKLFLKTLPETISGEIIRAVLDETLAESFSSAKKPYYINGTDLAGADYFTALDQNRGLGTIPEKVVPRYAVCIKRTVAMIFPTEDFISQDLTEIICNDMVSAEVMPFTGVAILQESVDGKWYYVMCGTYCGWVKKDTVALCRDREEWLAAIDPERFLVVTGNNIVLDETAVPTATGGMILPMGTVLKLADEIFSEVAGRNSLCGYSVLLPTADEKGMLAYEEAIVPVSKEVHVGYLSMTSHTVLRQAFRFLGQVYGWGGSLSANDCSGVIRQVYRCFGMELPRNSQAIASMKDLGSFDCTKMTTQKKLEVLREIPVGLPIFMEGHLMLYLGMDREVPYVISSCGSFIPSTDKSAEVVNANCVFVSDLNLYRKNGKTWLENLSYLMWKEY